MKPIGTCPCCSKKIGRRSANGRFFYDAMKMQQIMVIFGYPDRSEKTKYHVVVCKDCASNIVWADFEKEIADEPEYAKWKAATPDAVFEGVELEG